MILHINAVFYYSIFYTMENYFTTTDFLICTILIYFGHELQEIDKSNPSRCVFHILKKKETEKILNDLFNNKILVEPKRFFAVQKDLKQRIYN